MTFVLILLLLYTQMFLILWFSWLEKERKNQFKSETPRLLKLSVFLKPPPLTIPPAPPPRLLVFDIFSNRPYIPPPPSHLLETLEYVSSEDEESLLRS